MVSVIMTPDLTMTAEIDEEKLLSSCIRSAKALSNPIADPGLQSGLCGLKPVVRRQQPQAVLVEPRDLVSKMFASSAKESCILLCFIIAFEVD